MMRVGIAGLASLYWPGAIARGLRAHPHAELVAFATLGERGSVIRNHLGMSPAGFAAEYGARQYADPEDMVRREKLDAVAVCARHTEHARLVERLASCGTSIYIAKTYVTTMNDAGRIAAAQSRHGTVIAVGPSARFLPAIAAARRAVDAGRIGEPFSLRVCHHHGTIDVFGKHDFYRDTAEGGPELSLGWYVVDLVLQFLGGRVARVSAEYGNYTSPDSPFMDCGKLTMRMDSGAMASCDMYFCNRFPFPVWEMEIVGRRGAITIRQEEREGGEAIARLLTETGSRVLRPPAQTPHWEMFWVEDFRRGRKPALDAAYAAEVTRISLAARESARRGRTVTVGASGG